MDTAKKLADALRLECPHGILNDYEALAGKLLSALSTPAAADAPAPAPVALRKAFSLLDRMPINEGYHDEIVETLDALRAAIAASQPAPVEAQAVPTQAARDVLGERQRQISAEGWTPEHDEGEMAMAAAGYAVKASDQIQCVAHGFDESTLDDDVTAPQPGLDPWPHAWGFKPCPPRRALVKAGALILAEIERLDRAAPTPSKGEA